jgi:WD40 repeat protein
MVFVVAIVVSAMILTPGAQERAERRIRIGGLVTAVAFSPDGSELLAWDTVGYSRWNVESGRRVAADPVLGKACKGAPALPRSEDGRTIGVNCSGRLFFFDLRTGKPLGEWPLPKDQGAALYTPSPDGRLAAIVLAGALEVVEIRPLSGAGNGASIGIGGEVEHLSIVPGASHVIVGTIDGVQVRRLPDGQLAQTIDGRSTHATSDDGKRIAVASGAGAIVYDIGREAPVRQVEDRVIQLRFGGGGQLLAGWNNQTATVWDVTTGARRASVSGDEIVATALSPEGRRFATVNLDRRGGAVSAVVEIWRVSK